MDEGYSLLPNDVALRVMSLFVIFFFLCFVAID